jgi:Cu+-exporting ATPase
VSTITEEILDLTIQGMSCSHCSATVEQALRALPGVSDVTVSLDEGRAEIRHQGLSTDQAVAAVEEAGYAARAAEPESPGASACSDPDASTSVASGSWSAPAGDGQQLAISGATCAGCVRAIENALRHVPGVEHAEMNFADRTAQVSGSADTDALVQAVEDAGYGAKPIDDPDQADADKDRQEEAHYHRLLRDMTLSLVVGVPVMAWGLLGGSMTVEPGGTSQWVWLAVGMLTLGILVFAGGHFFTGAWKAFRGHNANMDTLIAVGTGTAWLYSMAVVLMPGWFPEAARHVYFEASAMIIGLINLGLALEVRARGKTGQAIRRLLDLRARTARVVRADGVEVDAPVEEVQRGDAIRARPGEKIAVDGEVIEGSSLIDESMLTGEPMPVRKEAGDDVAAGTLNDSGSLIYKATRVGKDTALARIIALVKKAQGAKPPIGRLADRVSAVFVPIILLIAVVAALAWFNLGPDPRTVHMMVAATTVLIIACPCALGLATPMSVMVGVGKAAEAGVLIRQGEALQTTARLDTIVLDKTGTITQGRPAVTRVFSANGEDNEIVRLAAALEKGSEHPLAQAVMERAGEQGQAPPSVRNFDALNGKGVQAELDGAMLRLGNRRWLEDSGVDLSTLEKAAGDITDEGGTPLFLAREQQALGVIGVADPVKDDSGAAIRRLHERGLEVVMITGDIQASADAIARQVGLDRVFAEVLPEHKADHIGRLRDEGRLVAMVGDGINDAPALAAADVGFAIGTGTDVAIESAGITLMRGSLHGVADAIEIAAMTLRNIKQNLFGAFAYNSLGVPVAAGVLYPFTGMLLNPVIAGAAMSLSSVTVVSNAGRLRFFRPGGRSGASP